ncbi:MAG: phytanoyl-CoA dioxygenase family protein [Bacteroidota bacterium]
MAEQDTTTIFEPPSGRINIYFLKEIWRHYQSLGNKNAPASILEWKYINAVFNTLGIGLEPTIRYLKAQSPSFAVFENWILQEGQVSQAMIDHFNSIVEQGGVVEYLPSEQVLTQAHLDQWDTDGYLILKNAIPKEDCAATAALIYETLEADPTQANTWYNAVTKRQGIMIQLFNTPLLVKNRLSKRIRLAFEQLWQRTDLLVSNDRVSFNPPETSFYPFQGPHLHWDMSLKRPIPFATQGLVYLTDTASNQGAFTVIPGFHNHIDSWLDDLPAGANPRDLNLLSEFERRPIAAEAGDLIIWNQCLPHGSSPNTSQQPRLVQYINYQPLDLEWQDEWI